MIKKSSTRVMTLLLILLCFIFSACNSSSPEPLPPIDTPQTPPDIEIPTNKTYADYTPLENFYITLEKINEYGIYRTETRGTVTAAKNLYTQNVVTYKKVFHNECFVQSASYSSFIKTAEQQYFTGNEIYYRTGKNIDKNCTVGEWNSEIKNYPKNEFAENYGTEPYGISKYFINEKTVLESNMDSDENGNILLNFLLSTDSAGNMIREIKTQSNTNDYPVFTSINITVIIDENWTIKRIITEEHYSIKILFMSLDCSTHFEENFYDIGNENLKVSEKEYFI